MTFKNLKRHNLIVKIVFVCIILLQLFRIVYSFAFIKQDYHPDETWSFGLANSYYEPYIYQDADETRLTHSGYWFSAEELKKYLTVEPNHRFSYGSVFYNQSKDLHPPLYYLILHTICSFFPGHFSFWFGFIINIVVFVFLEIYLYRLCKEVMKSEIKSLVTCAYFGFTSGALCMFVFVRMYALATLFATMSAFYHARLYNDNDLKHNLPGIFFVTLAGALTHHYYLVYAGTLSACFCFYYLFKKKFKYLIIYSFSLLTSVGGTILVFPATIDHAFGRRGSIQKLPLSWQAVMSLNCVLGELTGIQLKVGKTPVLTYMLCILLLLIVVVLPLCFLFRNEKWFIQLLEGAKNHLKKSMANFKHNLHSINVYPLFLLITAIIVWFVVFNSVSMIIMGEHTDRYLFIIYPLCCLIIICFCNFMLKNFFPKLRMIYMIQTLICLMFIVLSNYISPCIYLIPVKSDIRNVYEDSDIIYITESPNLLTQISKDVLNSKMIFMDKPENFLNNSLVFSNSDEDTPVYLLLDDSCLTENFENKKLKGDVIDNWLEAAVYSNNKTKWYRNELEEIILKNNPYHKCEYIGKDFITGFETSVYRIR